MLEKIVWAGANLRSFAQAEAALRELAGIEISGKRIRRITEQVGQDRLEERQQAVTDYRNKPLIERVASPRQSASPAIGVVMMDGGRYQRRDHFGQPDHEGSHWKEDKVGVVLGMESEVHRCDPHPEFPDWLAEAAVVREIAALRSFSEESEPGRLSAKRSQSDSRNAPSLTPVVTSRRVIASSETGQEFGWHLEQTAWEQGVVDADRMAFVADGASVNWTIHRRHFSQMTGILDLMHALSYAWRAAKVLPDRTAYVRYATCIWQGRVDAVIVELQQHQSNSPPPDGANENPLREALTYYANHRQFMQYPTYRQQGLPLTSSLMESTIKQINIRIKGSEKFFGHDTGETLLQLRADSLSSDEPLKSFWPRWHSHQTGANRYRKSNT